MNNKLSQKELDELTKHLAKICKSKGITKHEEIEAYLTEIIREAKLNDLINDSDEN